MHDLEAVICANCGKHLKMMPQGAKDYLPEYWLGWCNPRCLAEWRTKEKVKDETVAAKHA